ncbi:DoxX family protein [Sorangium sp. So ce131]|uniref:DoxX family protein n=1 Tax=Sorangium sp. So ce131 TaxID=3133282 RepID=UPI003F636AD4
MSAAATTAGAVSAAPALLARLVKTEDDRVAFALRIVLAAVMFPHGAQHLAGWFGGFGYAGTHGWMVSIGIPGPLATLAIATEFFAPLALLAGVGGRIAAAGLGAILLVAATTHAQHGFFMNWLGSQAGEGWEYHALGLAIAAAVVARGSGAWSVDRRLG